MLNCPNLIIANEKANWGSNRSKVRQVVDFLRERGFPSSVARTSHAGHATELAAAARERTDTIIVIGGDGTINEVLNGLLTSTPNPQSAICNLRRPASESSRPARPMTSRRASAFPRRGRKRARSF
jgi:diacylglycerol kinase family enzyme